MVSIFLIFQYFLALRRWFKPHFGRLLWVGAIDFRPAMPSEGGSSLILGVFFGWALYIFDLRCLVKVVQTSFWASSLILYEKQLSSAMTLYLKANMDYYKEQNIPWEGLLF